MSHARPSTRYVATPHTRAPDTNAQAMLARFSRQAHNCKVDKPWNIQHALLVPLAGWLVVGFGALLQVKDPVLPKGSSRCRVLSVVCGLHMIFAVLEMRLWDGIFLGIGLTAALMYICLRRDFNNGRLVRFYFRLDFIFFSCKTFILLANINFEAFSLVPNCEIYIWVENIREQKAPHTQLGKTDPFWSKNLLKPLEDLEWMQMRKWIEQ